MGGILAINTSTGRMLVTHWHKRLASAIRTRRAYRASGYDVTAIRRRSGVWVFDAIGGE